MDNNSITIVMYHYVRNLHSSKYPEIKGLDTQLFIEQILYFKKHYNFIDCEDLIEGSELPKNPILLTFDDGYIDNYLNVFPIMKKENITGCFFPVVDSSKNNNVLDINKIHFILASVSDKKILVDEINQYICKNSVNNNLLMPDEYMKKIPKSRFDTEDVVYIKCILQQYLPIELRKQLVEVLFRKYVTEDEKDFASTLYVNTDQLKEMHNYGMTIGAHGFNHNWLATLDKEEQIFEIIESANYLKSIGVKENEFVISYPFGSYNKSTLEIVKDLKFKLGFTTVVDFANTNNPMELSRFDTNDFPKDKNYSFAK